MVNFYLLETGREPPDVIVNYSRLDTWILIATHACSNQSGKNSPYSLMLMHLSAEVRRYVTMEAVFVLLVRLSSLFSQRYVKLC